ncbi:hypothetical protein [Ferrimicrobium sp.]|uniref:dCTP deaminase n=1 Tax=Ferrimicrobium sp. TaxID=2926050 RepID=UPI0026216840|nr:hypothetical protein [Ferrimicrobium sp.]
MILTGSEIALEVERGRIHIDDFDSSRIEPNSYGFRLGATILEYNDEILDAYQEVHTTRRVIPEVGLVFEPGKIYLGATKESMGSDFYAATLYARLSVSALGVWIQHSAPLGHCGAMMPWTLEIRVAQPVRLYRGMLIGKIAFWSVLGSRLKYSGRYSDSRDAVPSRFSLRTPATGQSGVA